MIPKKLEEWDLSVLNGLVSLKDIESEDFDFKGDGFNGLNDLPKHICAMANTSGGYIVCGIDDNKPGFKKNGFKVGTEKRIQDQINNSIIQLELYPTTNVRLYIKENNCFFPIIKIENVPYRKPFVVKGSCCYIRAGSGSVCASRSTIMNLFGNLLQRRNSTLRLRAACRDLVEQIQYTITDIQDANPKDPLSIIKPLNLNFIQNAVLDTDWLFIENKLYGGHVGEHSVTSGYYSFYNKLERLNLAIETFNRPIDIFNQPLILENRENIKKTNMRFWHTRGQDTKEALVFVEGIINKCNSVLADMVDTYNS